MFSSYISYQFKLKLQLCFYLNNIFLPAFVNYINPSQNVIGVYNQKFKLFKYMRTFYPY